jgi:GAF domain-containing protein
MTSATSQQLADAIQSALTLGGSLDTSLDQLLAATGARATGLWQVVGNELHQLGFRGVAEMPDVVKRDFAAATARVPLDRIGLGIVRAIVDRTPFLVKRQPGSRDLMTSPGWLERFECESSLAIPVFEGERPVGALAVSHAALIERDGPLWKMLVETAGQLSNALSQREPTSSTGS